LVIWLILGRKNCSPKFNVDQYNNTTITCFFLNIYNCRFKHEVIEVPVEFCDVLEGATDEPTRTETTPETTDTPIPGEESDNVAMIIGGTFDDDIHNPTVLAIELFGCPGYKGRSMPIVDLPIPINSMGAQYIPGGANGKDTILICGGFACETAHSCSSTQKCYQWTAEDGWEVLLSYLCYLM